MNMGKRLTLALAVFALVVVPLAIYTAGYFLLCQRLDHLTLSAPTQVYLIERHYKLHWVHDAYKRAGRAEQWIRGIEV